MSALLALLLGCSSAPSGPPERVLYLREALPADGSGFGRVNPRAYDLGSLSTSPPDRMEIRACGDVVAFAGAGAVLADEQLQVDEVLYRVWWYSGVGRGVFSLWTPEQGGGLARAAVSSCAVSTDDPAHEAGFFRSVLRVPVGRTLSGRDLAQLHVLLDVASAQVIVGSCPGRASLVVLNPPSDAVLRERDSDGDGRSDYDELYGTGDPWRPDDAGACLRHADPVAALPSCAAPALDDPRAGPVGELSDQQLWSGEVVRVEGTLTVRGRLRLEGATLVLAPGPSGRAGIEVLPGGVLEVVDGSALVAEDPAEGFSLLAREGSRLRLVDSRIDHPGHIELDPRGNAERAGVVVSTRDAEIRGNTVRFGLSAFEILADGVVLEGNRLEHDGTGVLVRGADVVLRGNTAVGGGVFVQVDDTGHRTRIEGNRVERTVDTAIAVRGGARGVVIVDNQLIDVHRALELGGARPLELRGNTLQSCLRQTLPEPGEGLLVADNQVARPNPERCRVVLESSGPTDPRQFEPSTAP